MPNGYSNDEANALVDASPLNYANTSSPYTILAYGNGSSCPNNEMGDGTVPYSQAQALETQLSNNGVQYDLYELIGVGHGYFDILINNSQYLIMLSSAFSTLKTN